MPILDDPKWEKFALLLFKGVKPRDAYVRVGYKDSAPNSSRMGTNAKIRARVKELDQKAVDRAIIDKHWVVEQLFDTYHAARKGTKTHKPNLAAANKALELIGIELRMFVKHSVNVRLEDMSETELVEFLNGEPSRDDFDHAARTLASARPAGTA